ncbi:ABC transporter permease subunit [Corynebacterium poyangense]|uniref:ABC transporter permease subunit n=1 Tax=Corynebacterium poyangense TaxID=2684405 RepID=A0A7H0SMX4_9CORY|nr:ABC transporter permease subunit [Corynebacterium poyangense]QNQ89899.1 ABC transporter permease subunit [Corynebacterium poyangense]
MTWLINNSPYFLHVFLYHLGLVIPALIISAVISLPLGWLAYKYPTGGAVILQILQLAYVVPVLALLVLFPAIVGLPMRSPITLVLTLSIYGVALLLRNTTSAFASVDKENLDIAHACGYSPQQCFFRVHLPLALPVILAGFRVAAMSTIAMASTGALVGIPSLGSLLTDGFQRGLVGEVLVGIIAILILAVVIDVALFLVGSLLLPWSRVQKASSQL